jgi:hypothetical protein
MKKLKFSLTVLTFLTFQIYGQTRTIVGRVLSEDVETLPGVRIQILDTVLISETDIEGRFKIKISQDTNKLILRAVGMEPTTIQTNNACDSIEIVMMYDGTYDFISPQKIDRLRLKRFKKLPDLHLQAYTKGLFSTKTECVLRTFESNKPYFDKIKKEQKKIDVQTKQTFEKLKIGDSIKIPYHGQYSTNEGDKLYVYSNMTDNIKYDCIVEGKVISKNKFKKGYNLVYKVTNFDICKSPTEYRGKPLEIGDVFTHNMRTFKILSE